MTTIERRALRVRSALSILAGVALAACGGSDSPGQGTHGSRARPSSPRERSQLPLDRRFAGSENVLVLVDTGLASISAKTNYTVTATGTGPPGAVSPPATSLVPLADAIPGETRARALRGWISRWVRLNTRSRRRFAGGFQAARSAYQAGTTLPRGLSRSVASAAPQVATSSP